MNNQTKYFEKVAFKLDRAQRQGLLDSRLFLNAIKYNGLHFLDYHFDWLEEKKLIVPIKTVGNKKLYSVYQLPILDTINDYKLETLEYPNPTYHPGLQKIIGGKVVDAPGLIKERSTTWQDHLLNNDHSVLESSKEWNELAIFFRVVSELKVAISLAAREINEENITQGMGTKSDLAANKKYLEKTAGRYYAKQIRGAYPKLTDRILRYWGESVLPAYVIKHNPLFRVMDQYPELQRIFSKQNSADTIFRKGNEVALANFYASLVALIDYFLICISGKGISSLSELTKKERVKESRICAICGKDFIPRRLGRVNVLCGSGACIKERDRRMADIRRKRR